MKEYINKLKAINKKVRESKAELTIKEHIALADEVTKVFFEDSTLVYNELQKLVSEAKIKDEEPELIAGVIDKKL